MKKVIILNSDDWQACYVDGNCIKQSHKLGEGMSFLHFIKEASIKYNFTLDDIKQIWYDEADEETLDRLGCFPDKFDDLIGNYDCS